jgi:hypothetical protein
MAESFRSTCGSERGLPECNKQRSPRPTPQVGQRTEDSSLGVNSSILIRILCDGLRPGNSSVWNTAGADFHRATSREFIVEQLHAYEPYFRDCAKRDCIASIPIS